MSTELAFVLSLLRFIAEEAPHRKQYFMRYDDSNVLLAERLRDAGYRTVAVSALDYVTSGGNIMQGITDVRAVRGVGLATENDGLVADEVVITDPVITDLVIMICSSAI